LFCVQDRNRRKNTECIGRQEDYLFSVRTFRYRFYDILDMINRIRYTSIFRYALICEIDLSVGINRNVFEKSVTCNGIVNIGFAFFIQVDNFGIATAFVVEHTVVVPTVFVVTDKQTFRVGRQSSFSRSGKTEEDSCALTFFIGVGRAVHRSHTFQRIQIVHDREDTFLHLTAVPSIQDNLFVSFQVENGSSFRVQTQLFVVVYFRFGCVERHEIGFAVVSQFFIGRTDKHVLHEVSLPCNLHDETNFQTSSGVSAAESIHYEQSLSRKLFNGFGFQIGPSCFRARLVVVLIFIGSPPDSIFAGFIHHKEFILRRTTGINTCHYIHSTEFSHLTSFITFQSCFGFFLKQNFVRRIV